MSAYAALERNAGKLTEADTDSVCTASIPGSVQTFQCMADNGKAAKAVHKWNGQNFCAYHSPFNVV